MSALAGVSISLACALVWGVSLRAGRRGGGRGFMKAYLAGMAVRLALAGSLSAWALAAVRVRIGVFLAALLGSYAALLGAEIWWLARRPAAIRPAAGGGTNR
jgi:hypothetical protein